jgi:hypothetical protein
MLPTKLHGGTLSCQDTDTELYPVEVCKQANVSFGGDAGLPAAKTRHVFAGFSHPLSDRTSLAESSSQSVVELCCKSNCASPKPVHFRQSVASESVSGVTGLTSPMAPSSRYLDTRLNWEMLFLPYRSDSSMTDVDHIATSHGNYPPQYISPSPACCTEKFERQSSLRGATTSLPIASTENSLDNETGIVDEPDLSLVSGVTSVDLSGFSPEKTTSAPARLTPSKLLAVLSSPLISFEPYEHSLKGSLSSDLLARMPIKPSHPYDSREPSDSRSVNGAVTSDMVLNLESVSPLASDEKCTSSENSLDAKFGTVRFTLTSDNKSEDVIDADTERWNNQKLGLTVEFSGEQCKQTKKI